MLTIENDVLETAKKSVDDALAEYKKTGDRYAFQRYLEALRAYRTMVTVRYNLR